MSVRPSITQSAIQSKYCVILPGRKGILDFKLNWSPKLVCLKTMGTFISTFHFSIINSNLHTDQFYLLTLLSSSYRSLFYTLSIRKWSVKFSGVLLTYPDRSMPIYNVFFLFCVTKSCFDTLNVRCKRFYLVQYLKIFIYITVRELNPFL